MSAPIVSGSTWMTQCMSHLGTRTLANLALPGAHDSGTSVFTASSLGSNPCNTQTQSLNILGQLECGVRYFDFRPVTWPGLGDFYHGHVSKAAGLYWGSACQSLSSALNQIVQFVQQPGCQQEVVILKLSHFVHLVQAFDPNIKLIEGGDFTLLDFQNLVTMVVDSGGPFLFTSSSAGILLNTTPLANLASGSGRIIVVLDLCGGKPEGFPAMFVDPSRGIFSYNDFGNGPANLVVYDEYSDSNDLSYMAANQQQKFRDFTGHPGCAFLLSWTLTESNPFGTCIVDLARTANMALDGAIQSWAMQGIVNSQKIPNVVYTDFVSDPSVSLTAAMYLNYLF
jgi:hypothetical protein